ncbi:MAG TPA: ATP-dependent RNA helicase HrpA, partial [Pseudomonadales bacterium]|nr:ATP-dependent RNA helicase HrpA [Pseudomonadales bacterium]
MDFQQLQERIEQTLLKDRFRFSKRLFELKQQVYKRQAKPSDLTSVPAYQTLCAQVSASQAAAEQRHQHRPTTRYDETLPICQRREEILAALQAHQVIIVAGETGSGKTTQLPKLCLDAGRGIYGVIGHTQPRRLAARSVAERIAIELNSPLGRDVGYKIRFNEQLNDATYIKLMTDGILLAEIQQDRYLRQYDTIIIDEAHERSLNIDFLLGYLKKILPQRPDLKVIITSATIDHLRFSGHFNDAPVIEVVGRTYPVTTLYRPPLQNKEDNQDYPITQAVLTAIEEIIALEGAQSTQRLGGILVFCSGEQEIRELALFLRRCNLAHTEILPLYARLSHKDQQKIFSSPKGRRIVISTNVAETSLTVPSIHYVIDLGKARISRYSYRSKVQRLHIEPISQASANQRQGRCGRITEGLCIRLYSEDDFLSRRDFTEPEIQRTNLASVILQMEFLGLGLMENFPFIDPPDPRFIRDGYGLLQELGAMTDKKQLTALGRMLASLPVDPRLGRMLVEAKNQGSLKEMLIVASALAAQDPRERPHEFRQQADAAHRTFQDERSDFLSLIKLWFAYEEQRQALSQNQLKSYCRTHFLNFMRMKEWRDIHHQLRLACKQLDFVENQQDADYAALHKAILSGLLGQIGCKNSEGLYQGARNSVFELAPGSPLSRKKPQWIMAAELRDTHRLLARQLAQIEPQWAEELAPHLIKHRYSDPVWRKRRGEVVARQTSTLYGLILQAERYVSYASIDPELCREMFISEGLVKGDMHTDGAFLLANQTLVSELETFEHKTRRRDILVDEQVIHDF